MLHFKDNSTRNGSSPGYPPVPKSAPPANTSPLAVRAYEPSGGATAWHSLTAEEVLRQLHTSREGLTGPEARLRLQRVGLNRLPERKPTPPLVRFLRQFRDVLVYILLLAGVVSAFLGDWKGTTVILGVVVINACIGFMQEGKAQAALASLRRLLTVETTVLRDHARKKMAASDLVPGDVVYLDAGDRVPADLRVLSARSSQVEEAMLTGESVPVEKQAGPVAYDTLLAERKSMVYSGTLLTRGSLTGVVVATGKDTELGRINELVARVETVSTPLLEKMHQFGKRLSLLILLVSVLLFAYGWLLTDYSLRDLFLITVGLAVAAIPEGLPAILTIILALGVQRMARRKAIIRRLPVVETLGSVTVICTDKTGTLTKNEMTVREVVLADTRFTVSGIGYAPEGQVIHAGRRVNIGEHPVLEELIQAGLLSSEAALRQDGQGGWQLEGDPTEGALVVLAWKAAINRERAQAVFPCLDTIPFDSEQKFMATLHPFTEGENMIFLKGAPEVVLLRCAHEQTGRRLRPLRQTYWEEAATSLAKEGYRVLALARKRTGRFTLEEKEVATGLTLLGLVGIVDPPRPEAVTAVRKCQQAGIRVKMITGDHAETARAIGEQLGLGRPPRVITGSRLERMGEAELQAAVREYDVFARTSPAHKLRLVAALQAQGEVVAMTGDGVNDAPALKRADVGIAMGGKGSEAAKEAAQVVLTDDNFATLQRAVAEGRTLYDNLRKAILFLLPTNGAQALMMLLAVVFSLHQLPITPLQILWVNMVTAVTLSLALAFEPAESNVMNRPPRPRTEPLLTGPLIRRIALVSGLICALSLGLFFFALGQGALLAQAQTLAINTLVFGQIGYLFSSRLLMRSSFSFRGILGNPVALLAAAALLLLQVLFTYLPLFHQWMGTAALSGLDWLCALGAAILIFALAEGEKAFSNATRSRYVPKQYHNQAEP